MSLDGILSCSLPDIDLERVVKAETPAKKKRVGRRGPRKRWTVTAIAKRIGVDHSFIYYRLKDNETFRALLRWDEASKGREHLTDEEVDRAAAYLVEHHICRWARAHDACVECQRTDSKHVGRGRCERCTKRRQRGGGAIPFPGAWDRTRGHERCLGCHTSELPHFRAGLCERCDQWARRTGWHQKTKTVREKEAIARRRRLRRRRVRA